MKKQILFAAMLLCGTPVLAARTISVSGEAEVKVAPNEVVITLGVETLGPELTAVKRDNDGRVKAVIAAIRRRQVESKDIQTDQISISPEYDRPAHQQPKLLDYVVRKNIVVTLKDVAKFEDVLADAVAAGANYVHGAQFRTTELRKNRDQARALAVKAAQEKAQAMAEALGQKLGKPQTVQVSEYGSRSWSPYGYPWWGGGYGYGQGASQNVVQNSGGGPEAEGSMAVGQISVSATVSGTFELE
ncbi:MAG: SIMPL domain-containing protein [Elusimicrobia bacterium]|nr:SIMPL domain-containing protein [Elusimicrobiota bacterium]